MMMFDKERSPADRGEADSYYGRAFRPHKIDKNGFAIYELTAEEKAEYTAAFYNNKTFKDFE